MDKISAFRIVSYSWHHCRIFTYLNKNAFASILPLLWKMAFIRDDSFPVFDFTHFRPKNGSDWVSISPRAFARPESNVEQQSCREGHVQSINAKSQPSKPTHQLSQNHFQRNQNREAISKKNDDGFLWSFSGNLPRDLSPSCLCLPSKLPCK